MADLSQAKWHKSSSSENNGCIEVAIANDGGVAVRDSKDRSGSVLLIQPHDWTAFLRSVRGVVESPRPREQPERGTSMGEPASGAGNLGHVLWRTSTLSNNGSCVEVAFIDDDGVVIRDSKNRQGPVLRFTGVEWNAFVGGVHRGEFDLPG